MLGAHTQKTQPARGWASCDVVCAYGVTAWVEWLPCGMHVMAVGLGADAGYGVAWAAVRLPALGSMRKPEIELPSKLAV